MSDEYRINFSPTTNEDSNIAGRIVGKIVILGIGVIIGLAIYCCRRVRRNTGTVLSQPVVHQSNYNAVPLPPPATTRTNEYQAPYIHPPQSTSNAPSAPDANVLPPAYDKVCSKQPPYYKAAY